MKQHIFLRDAWIGARDIPTYVSLGTDAKVANSYALFCPKCAAVWGKLMHDHPDAYCQPIPTYCIEHAHSPGDATFTIQSHWDGDPRDFHGPKWPASVLKHDLLALTNFYLNHPEKAAKFL